MNLSINHQLGILLNPEKIQFHKKKLKGMVYDIPFATLLSFLRPKIAVAALEGPCHHAHRFRMLCISRAPRFYFIKNPTKHATRIS